MSLPCQTVRPDCVLSSGVHNGFNFIVMHNTMGYRCGYVHVPLGHPWDGKGGDDLDVNVHGGLTYSEPDDQPNSGHWFGFDCAHAGDASDPDLPASYRMRIYDGDVIRTQEYVEAECRNLCKQAAAATPSPTPTHESVPAPDLCAQIRGLPCKTMLELEIYGPGYDSYQCGHQDALSAAAALALPLVQRVRKLEIELANLRQIFGLCDGWKYCARHNIYHTEAEGCPL